jgi:hypothetical protein
MEKPAVAEHREQERIRLKIRLAMGWDHKTSNTKLRVLDFIPRAVRCPQRIGSRGAT